MNKKIKLQQRGYAGADGITKYKQCRINIPYEIIQKMGWSNVNEITVSLESTKRNEENGIFRFFYTKCRRSIAVILQLIIEAVFVLVLPSLVFPREFEVKLFWDYTSSAIFAGIVGIFHLIAWHHNRKNVREILDNQKIR